MCVCVHVLAHMYLNVCVLCAVCVCVCQVEELGVVLSADQVPHIQNDCITISK